MPRSSSSVHRVILAASATLNTTGETEMAVSTSKAPVGSPRRSMGMASNSSSENGEVAAGAAQKGWQSHVLMFAPPMHHPAFSSSVSARPPISASVPARRTFILKVACLENSSKSSFARG